MERILRYNDDLPVNIEAMTVKSFPAHCHMDMQIIYVLKGEVDLRLTYVTYNLKPGDMHFIHREDIHSLKGVTEDNLVLLFNFNVDAFSSLYPDFYMQIFTTRVGRGSVTYEKKLRLRDCMFEILTELVAKDGGYSDRIYDTSKEMLRILYRDFRGFYIDSEERVFRHAVSSDPVQIDRISRVTNFVYENYPYKLSLNEIAENEHISKFYLSHLFQKYVGPSFRDFVSMVRVEMSEHQLLNSNIPISRIAQECGFSHPKYYIEHFKTWFGYHPGEYRKKFQKETIDYVEPQITEIPLEALFGYQDVAPVFEDDAGNENKIFRSLKISIDSPGKDIDWKNILEVNIESCLLNNQKIKEIYMEFHEVTVEKGLKTNICTDKYNENHEGNRIDYFKYDPQLMAVERLNTMILSHIQGKSVKWKANFLDINDGKNGLITMNGHKKPLYYLFMFLCEMYDRVIKIGKDHFVCKDDGNIKMILFNKDPEDMFHMDIMFEGLTGGYRLTEMNICRGMSFMEHWRQLDYKQDLSPKDTMIINSMSFPRGRFETIPDIKQYVYHCDIDPLEILELDLVRIDKKCTKAKI